MTSRLAIGKVHPVSQQMLTWVPLFPLESLYMVVVVIGDESLEALIALSTSFTISGSILLSSRLKFVLTALLAEKTLLALAGVRILDISSSRTFRL